MTHSTDSHICIQVQSMGFELIPLRFLHFLKHEKLENDSKLQNISVTLISSKNY